MIILRHKQKEFGKITKHLPKSISKYIDTRTRPVKAAIGRKRRKIAASMENKILEDLEKSLGKSGVIKEGAQDDKVSQKIIDSAEKKYKTKVSNLRNRELRHNAKVVIDTSSPEAQKEIANIDLKIKRGQGRRYDLEYKKDLSNPENKSVIQLGPDTKTSGVAHELGHVENRYGNNPIKKKISELDTAERRQRHSNIDLSEKKNIGSVLSDLADGFIINQEERNASKNAMKMLKKAGMSKSDLKESKKALKEAGKTYQKETENKLLADARSLIQIPSRKSLNIKDNTLYPENYIPNHPANIKRMKPKMLLGEEGKFKRKK